MTKSWVDFRLVEEPVSMQMALVHYCINGPSRTLWITPTLPPPSAMSTQLIRASFARFEAAARAGK
jgi:hypothetical protein